MDTQKLQSFLIIRRKKQQKQHEIYECHTIKTDDVPVSTGVTLASGRVLKPIDDISTSTIGAMSSAKGYVPTAYHPLSI